MPIRANQPAPTPADDDEAIGTPFLRPNSMHEAMHGSRDADELASKAMHVERADEQWVRPTNLDAPTARPGMEQRYVRFDSDTTNWSMKWREGWRPRDPATVPSAEAMYQKAMGPDGSEVCRIGNLILCERPAQISAQRRAYYQGKVQQQDRSAIDEAEKVGQEAARHGFGTLQREDKQSITVNSRNGRRPPVMVD
jgi:hypothetical protein